MQRTAYVDEAFRHGPTGCYVIAAIVVSDSRANDLRDDLRQLVKGRHRRFHWHGEEPSDRNKMLEFIAEAHLRSHIISKDLPKLSGQERARAHCLERLLWELKERTVLRLVLESRQARNNGRDRSTIMAAQVAGKAAPGLKYEFGLPAQEPLLWMADAISSAVAAGLYAGGDAPLQMIADGLERVAL